MTLDEALDEEGKILRAAADSARDKLLQATAEYAAAQEDYDKYLDRSIEAINQAQRAIMGLS